MNKYTFFLDDGHGWLKVKKAELFALNIADKISGYSYQFGAYAYLEEDSDLARFIQAIGKEKWAIIRDSLITKRSSFSRIRLYARYIPIEYRKEKPGDYVSFVGNAGIYQIIDKNTVKDKNGNNYRMPKHRLTGEFFEGF